MWGLFENNRAQQSSTSYSFTKNENFQTIAKLKMQQNIQETKFQLKFSANQLKKISEFIWNACILYRGILYKTDVCWLQITMVYHIRFHNAYLCAKYLKFLVGGAITSKQGTVYEFSWISSTISESFIMIIFLMNSLFYFYVTISKTSLKAVNNDLCHKIGHLIFHPTI